MATIAKQVLLKKIKMLVTSENSMYFVRLPVLIQVAFYKLKYSYVYISVTLNKNIYLGQIADFLESIHP